MLFTKSTDSGRFWLIRGDCELVDEEIWWTGIFPLTLPLAPLSLSQSQDVLTFKFSPGHFQENIRDLALQANLLLESIKALNLLFYCTMNDNYGGHSWISRVFLPTHNHWISRFLPMENVKVRHQPYNHDRKRLTETSRTIEWREKQKIGKIEEQSTMFCDHWYIELTLVWFVYFNFPYSQMGSQVQPLGLPVNLIMRLKVHLH